MKREMKKRGAWLLLILVLIIFFSLSLTSAASRICYTSANCTQEIGNASSGDIITLNNSISILSGTSLDFGNKSHVIFDCNGSANYLRGGNLGVDYGIVLNSAINTTIRNCNISQFYFGVYLNLSSNNTLVNNTVGLNTYYGILFSLSSNNNTLLNNTANNNSYGISSSLSSNNTFTNNTANSNSFYGIYLSLSSHHILKNNLIQENNLHDFYITGSYCNNTFVGNTGSGGRAIEYYNNASVIENKTLSELILCDADNSRVANITIHGSNIKNNSMLYLLNADNVNLTDINSSQNYDGIYLQDSTGNNLSRITANNNSNYGIFLNSSRNNIIFNATLKENVISDFSLSAFSILDCNNNLTNLSVSNSGLIGFYNYPVVLQNKTFSEVIFCNASYSNVDNITIIGSSNFKNNGFYVYQTNNTNISNINSSYNYYGLYLQHSHKNNLIDTSSHYNVYGISLWASNNNTITRALSSYNSVGIHTQSSNYTTLLNGVSSYNSLSGLHLSDLSDNLISNITSNNNLYGFIFEGGIYNNTLRDSFIQFSGFSGLFINYSLFFPQDNHLYNNYWNDSTVYSNPLLRALLLTNISFDQTAVRNHFNTTKTVETNIVGGKYLGGNYYADPNGTGYSQTCADVDGDGICDAAYDLDGINYDYLPLTCTESWSCTAWSSCSGGIQTRACSDVNLCQTYRTKPIESQTCFGIDSEIILLETSIIPSISTEEPALVQITNSYSSFRTIKINAKNNMSNVTLTISRTNISFADFQILAKGGRGKSYEAYTIEFTGSNSDIEDVTIEFKVNKTWLDESGFNTSNLALYRKPTDSATWNVLETTVLPGDKDYYYFSAISKGFSTFLIFIGEDECVPAEKRCFENQVQFCLGNKKWLVSETCDYKCVNGACVDKGLQVNLNPLIVYPIIGIVVVGVLISFLVQRMPKKKRKKK